KLLDSVLVLTKDELIKNNVAITVEGSCAKQLEIYSNEFKHLLLNIINNAKDALVENNIQDKKIACTIQEEPNQTVVIIADNGGGIPQNIIDKIFEPRFTTKAAGKGSGIGLYISRQIAQKIGASIDVENKNGGAVFRISIPHGGNK
ncbi:MAG: sensor histidine kinase, partial [Campylobacterota bacterium]